MVFGLGKRWGGKSGKDGSAAKESRSRSKDKAKGRKSSTGLDRFGRKGRSQALGGVNKLFHGVAVRPRDESCCEAVTALDGQRFLSEEAPLLPLAECSNPQGCRCVYEHFDERRDNLRRESDVGLPVRTQLEEKREGLGRRITDG